MVAQRPIVKQRLSVVEPSRHAAHSAARDAAQHQPASSSSSSLMFCVDGRCLLVAPSTRLSASSSDSARRCGVHAPSPLCSQVEHALTSRRPARSRREQRQIQMRKARVSCDRLQRALARCLWGGRS
eukprot:3938818-Rhodomonas_salina.1